MPTLKLHSSVVYVDEYGVARDALVTAIHGGAINGDGDVRDARNCVVQTSATPAVNLVFVSGDSQKWDSSGRQIERRSSCVHASNNSAHGNYWRHVDDVPKETEQTHLL